MEKLYAKHLDLGERGSIDACIHVIGDSESIKLTKSYLIKGRDKLGIFEVVLDTEIEKTEVQVTPTASVKF